MSTTDLESLELIDQTTDSSSENSDDFNKPQPKSAMYSIVCRKPRVYGGLMEIKRKGEMDHDHSFPKGSNNMEYLKFKSVVDLDVSGKIPLRKLFPNKTYKGVLEVKLANNASGWDGNPVTLEVSIPGSLSSSSTHNVLNEKSLTSATFSIPEKTMGYLSFRLHQKSEDVKKGLIIKRFIIRKA